MTAVQNIIRFIFKLLFGSFNGIQVFLFPLTLFWWIDSSSFWYAVTGLVTIKRHYFPLTIFLLLLFYIAFLILKNHSYIVGKDSLWNNPDRGDFFDAVIDIHATLMITLICFGLLYVFAAFMRYYYGITVHLRVIYPFAFRAFSILLILYYVVFYSWLKPYRIRNLSIKRARRLLQCYWRNHPLGFVSYVLNLVLIIIACSVVYHFLVKNLLLPCLPTQISLKVKIPLLPLSLSTQISLRLFLMPLNNIYALLYDIFVFAVAFMLSNLLFSPFMAIFRHLADKIHPDTLRHHAQKNIAA